MKLDNTRRARTLKSPKLYSIDVFKSERDM